MAAASIAAAVGVAGRDFMILAGTASPALGAAIAQELGVPVGACDIARYPDGEVAVQLRESVARVRASQGGLPGAVDRTAGR